MAPTIHRGDIMTKTLSRIAVLVAIFVAQATSASAADIKVYATIGVKHLLEVLTTNFEKASGNRVSITWGTGAGLAKRIQAGEQADYAPGTRHSCERWQSCRRHGAQFREFSAGSRHQERRAQT